jgi:hypothetical protein
MVDCCAIKSDIAVPSLRRLAVVVLSCGVLAGCSNSAGPLLAPPQNTQTGQLPAKPATGTAVGPAVGSDAKVQAALKNCTTTAESAKPIGVAAMLAQAKTTPDAPKSGQISKAESDCLAARIKAQLIATAPAAPAAPAGDANALVPSKGSDLTIDFDSETAPVSPKDKRVIADMLAKKGKASKVRIFAGRGGGGNMFDQAVVAQRRANSVKELLPPGMVVSIEFDPLQVDDTVRIEFVDKT